MSLESIVLCRPCLSLSLLFCLDLCTSSEHCRVTRLPLAFASGTRVHLWGGAFPVGGGGRLFSFFSYESKDRACSQHEWGRQGAPVIYSSGGGTARAAFFGGGQRGPLRRLQTPAPKPADQGGARRTGGLSAGTRHLVPLIPARLRKTSGALIVTVLVTIQGSARALSTPGRAPSRPGTNGGAQAERIIGFASGIL